MKRMAFIIALAGLVSQGWGGWKVKEIVNFDKPIIAITIGKGRNDDTNRLYCWADNTIKEVTYSEGSWHTVQICSLPSFGGFISTKGGMSLAKGRNDGVMRLYAVSDSNLWEFTFSNGEWKGISFPVVDHLVQLTGLLAGPARNDDTVRLYSGIPDRGIIELTWRGNKWVVSSEIHSHGADFPIAIGKGRNDDIVRFYCGYGTRADISLGMSEWRYDNGQWVKKSSIGGDSIQHWTMGDGRNDSLMRIYGVYLHIVEPEYYHIREFTYTDREWKLDIIDDNLLSRGCLGIGDGRNQKKNYVYIAGIKGGLYEYEWKEGVWKRDTVLPDTFLSLSKILLSSMAGDRYSSLIIGKARNDDTNRIYYAPAMGKSLLEITWEKEGIEESSDSAKENILRFSLYPNPFSQKIKIEWQGRVNPLSLEIYNAIGQKVKSFNGELKTPRVIWDGKDNKGNILPNGVYFCRFQTGGKSSMKKVVLKR